MIKQYRTTEGKTFTFKLLPYGTTEARFAKCRDNNRLALLYKEGIEFIDEVSGHPTGLVMAEDVTDFDLTALIHDKMNEIFLAYQEAHNIESGDIDPYDTFKIMEVESSIANLIKSIYEKEVK